MTESVRVALKDNCNHGYIKSEDNRNYIPTIYLTDEVAEWLDKYGGAYEIVLVRTMHKTDGLFLFHGDHKNERFEVEFQDKKCAVLFKLTWT